MGIFEKSIPKYVVNPIQQQVEIAPEPVVIDDIFDPILNANAVNALRSKYGEGAFAVLGGYEELLNNIWGNPEGDLAGGLSLLGSFGRSMEKADDLILGAATESIKGLSGQGFQDPLHSIFVEDKDYTGRGLLAATANTMRGLAGASVDESDFGAVWAPTSLAIELGTDVGILGGVTAKTFAPAAKDLSSKQILMNLGKGSPASTLGEIGQLMSNYDDLMTQVAIDITAPGLRPAFTAFADRLADIFGTDDVNDFYEHVRTKVGNDPLAAEILKMYQNVRKKIDEIPVSQAELYSDADKMPSQIIEEVVEHGPSNRLDDFLQNAPTQPTPIPAPIEKRHDNAMLRSNVRRRNASTKNKNDLEVIDWWRGVDDAFASRNEKLGEAIEEVVKRAEALKMDATVGIDRLTTSQADFLKEVKWLLSNKLRELGVDASTRAELTLKLSSDDAIIEGLETGKWVSDPIVNSAVELVIHRNVPKRNLFISLYNNAFSLSPSELSRIDAAGAIGSKVTLDALREAVPFKTVEEFDKYFNSKKMTAALNAYFPPLELSHAAKNNYYANFDDSLQVDRVEKFKTLLKKALFPEDSNLTEYVKSIEELLEYVDDYAASTGVGTPNALILDSVPSQKRVLNKLYRTLDDVQTHFAQPIQNLQPRSLDFTGRRTTSYFQNEAVERGLSGDYGNYETFAQALFSKLAPQIKDEPTLRHLYEPLMPFMELKVKKNVGNLFDPNWYTEEYVREYLTKLHESFAKQKGTPVQPVTDKEVAKELSRLRTEPYGNRRSVHSISSSAYDDSKRVAERFYIEGLPLLETWVEAGGISRVPTGFRPHTFTDEKYEKFNRLLNRQNVSDPDPRSEDFQYVLEQLVQGYTKTQYKFDPKYPEASFKGSSDYYRLAHSLKEHAMRPFSLEGFVKDNSTFQRSLAQARRRGFSTDSIEQEVQGIVQHLRAKMNEFGFKSEAELEDAMSKAGLHITLSDLPEYKAFRAKQNAEFNELIASFDKRRKQLEATETGAVLQQRLEALGLEEVAARKKLASSHDIKHKAFAKSKDWQSIINKEIDRRLHELPDDVRRGLQAYIIEYEKAVRQMPYHAIDYDLAGVSATGDFKVLRDTIHESIRSKVKEDKLHPRHAGRLLDLLSKEADAHYARSGTEGTVSKYTSEARLAEMYGKELSTTAYRDTVLYSLPFGQKVLKEVNDNRFEAMSRFLGELRNAIRRDSNVPESIKTREASIKAYAESHGKKYSPPVSYKDQVCKKYFGTSWDEVSPMLEEYFEAETLDTELLKHGYTATRDSLSKEFPYSPENARFVKEHLISRLPFKYRETWRPSKEKGLFYFDIIPGSPAKAIRIGDTFDVRPGDFQRRLRSGMSYTELMAVPPNRRPLTEYIDYTKIASPIGREKLARRLADTHIRMEYFSKVKEPLSTAIAEIMAPKRRTLPNVTDIDGIDSIVKQTIANADPAEVAKLAYESPSVIVTNLNSKFTELFGEDFVSLLKQTSDKEALKRFADRSTWSLFEKIQNAMAVPIENLFRDKRATLRQQHTEQLAERFRDVAKKANTTDFRRFYDIRTKVAGDVVSGKEFWTEFRRSGKFVSVYAPNSPMIASVEKALTANANAINTAVGKNIVEVVTFKVPNGNTAVAMQFVYDRNLVGTIQKAQKELDALTLSDVVFAKPQALSADDVTFMQRAEMQELSSLMDELRVTANDQARYLGFDFSNNPQYTRHVMAINPGISTFLQDTFYTPKFTSADVDDLTQLISNLDGYRQMDRGAFGAVLQGRRYRGDVSLISEDSIFEYDPVRVFNSTLADGIFANTQYQTFVDLFLNDNFKIKEWFKTPEDLKEVLYAAPAGGKSGNLRNLDLVTFRTDANGRVVGLTKYDKLSDEGLAKALADEGTILVPSAMVAHLDNIFRKEVRLNDKFWTFINKHFTTPFKFGILANPGFLLGNVSDATLKLTTSMSKKYGTSMAEEAVKASQAMKATMTLKNTFGDVFEQYLADLAKYGVEIAPEAKIPDIVAMFPKHRGKFIDYINGNLTVKVKNATTGKIEDVKIMPSVSQSGIDQARVWLLLQSFQMDTHKLKELEIEHNVRPDSKFEAPKSLWDNVLTGRGKYDPKNPTTWGVAMNNPAVNTMLDLSGGWESLIRTAAIIDDLRHKGYTAADLAKMAPEGLIPTDVASKNFAVDMANAANAMYHSQFNYERVNNIIDGVGKAVPFPMFFLKNFQYWMELFMENPQYVDNAIDIQEGLWGHRTDDDGEDEFATDAKYRGAIPIGMEGLPEWFNGVYKPAPLQSMFSAFSLLQNPVEDLTYRAHPFISGAANAVHSAVPNDLTGIFANPESVKYRPYSENPYERNIKAGDPNFNPLEYAVHRANPFERAMSAQMRVPAKIRQGDVQLSDFLPSVFQPDFS